MTNPIKIGIAGLGTVGIGVVKIIQQNEKILQARTGRKIEIVAVSAKTKTKNRGVDLSKYQWESDPVSLAKRKDIDIFVELIGGHTGAAKDSIVAAIDTDKDIVTANKALLAHSGQELAEKTEGKNKLLRFEAAVAGGIPVIKALTEGLAQIPQISKYLTAETRKMQKKIGQKKFYLKLLKKDKFIKNKIDPTDVQRSLRAYEVIYFTKKSIFEWYKKTKSQYKKDEFLKIYIDYPKEQLVNKISKRVDQMIKDGAVEEVKNFEKLNLKNDNNLNKVIGIREIKDFIDKKTSFKEMKLNIVIKTRQYAKRQRTWSRGQMSDWQKFDPKGLLKFIKKL